MKSVQELVDQLVAVVGDHLLRRFHMELATREALMLAQAERQARGLDDDEVGAAADHVRRRAAALLGESSSLNGAPAPASILPSAALPGPGIDGKVPKRGRRAKSPLPGAGIDGTLAQITDDSEATLAAVNAATARFHGADAEEG